MFCTKINCLLIFFSYLFLFLFETEQGNTEIFQLLLYPTPASRHPNFGEWIRLKPVAEHRLRTHWTTSYSLSPYNPSNLCAASVNFRFLPSEQGWECAAKFGNPWISSLWGQKVPGLGGNGKSQAYSGTRKREHNPCIIFRNSHFPQTFWRPFALLILQHEKNGDIILPLHIIVISTGSS